MEYTECEKMQKVSDKSQKIGQFLEWLREQGLTICEIQEDFPCEECGEESMQYVEHYRSIEQRLADFFEIDLDKVEDERQHMLKELQKQNNK